MNETHDSAMFAPLPGVHDGCYLITKHRCPVKLAKLNARLVAIGEPPAWFVVMTAKMAEIQDTKGGDAVPASNTVQPVTI
jgi:hypothetical protein